MIRTLARFSTLLSLLICVGACATQKEKPVVEYVDRSFVPAPPAYLAPHCQRSTPTAAALATCGSAVDAWLADSTALDDCAAQFGAAWAWQLGAATAAPAGMPAANGAAQGSAPTP